MGSTEFRTAFLPYCLQKQPDGRYAVLNRRYKPIGFVTNDHIAYEAYPVLVTIRGLTARKVALLSHDSNPNADTIYLYNDGCVPTRGKKNMRAYLSRIELLASMTVSR